MRTCIFVSPKNRTLALCESIIEAVETRAEALRMLDATIADTAREIEFRRTADRLSAPFALASVGV